MEEHEHLETPIISQQGQSTKFNKGGIKLTNSNFSTVPMANKNVAVYEYVIRKAFEGLIFITISVNFKRHTDKYRWIAGI
jgi:hypothetical protein